MVNEIQYLLICLIEECAEVQHRATKAMRFGLDEIQPNQPMNNDDRLREELHDLFAVIELLAARSVGGMNSLNRERIDQKKEKVLHFMAYSRMLGILEKR